MASPMALATATMQPPSGTPTTTSRTLRGARAARAAVAAHGTGAVSGTPKRSRTVAEARIDYAAIVAGRRSNAGTEPLKTAFKLGADAPEFVPFAAMTQQDQAVESTEDAQGQRRRGRRRGGAQDGRPGPGDCSEMPSTVTVSGLPCDFTYDAFKEQLDVWGLLGTYDFFMMPMDPATGLGAGFAIINFIDPMFVILCQWILVASQFPATVDAAETQGLESCLGFAEACKAEGGVGAAPYATIAEPVPSQWAVNATNELLSPPCRGRYRKTKLCVFNRKGRCAMGPECPFAHAPEELEELPDLAYTKLCYHFFRGKCVDSLCKYAHGSKELRLLEADQFDWNPAAPGTWADLEFAAEAGFLQSPLPQDFLSFLSAGMMPFDLEMEELAEVYEDFNDDIRAVSLGGTGGGLCGASNKGIATTIASRRRSATSAADAWAEVGVRQRGTFMEALEARVEDGPTESLRRSWSDGDLPAFRAAMDDCELV